MTDWHAKFEWDLAIDRNRNALLRIVTAMFAMIGLDADNPLTSLPRHLHRAVLLVLRPAESAVRRLIIIAARDLSLSKQTRSRAFPDFSKLPKKEGSSERAPLFALFDTQKRFELIYGPRRKAPKFMPRIRVLDAPDPLVPLFRRIEVPEPEPPILSRDDMIDAAWIIRRLKAVHHALNTLPKQARRLVKAQAYRATLPAGPKRMPPMRPGHPPGHRKRHIHEVDEVLKDCHGLAVWLREKPK